MVLICLSLMISGVEYLFMSVGYPHFLFGKMSIQVFCPLFDQVAFFFFDVELYEFFPEIF